MRMVSRIMKSSCGRMRAPLTQSPSPSLAKKSRSSEESDDEEMFKMVVKRMAHAIRVESLLRQRPLSTRNG